MNTLKTWYGYNGMLNIMVIISTGAFIEAGIKQEWFGEVWMWLWIGAVLLDITTTKWSTK